MGIVRGNFSSLKALALIPDGKNLHVTVAGGAGAGQGNGVYTLKHNRAPTCTNVSASVNAGSTTTLSLSCADSNGETPVLAVAATPPLVTLNHVGPVTAQSEIDGRWMGLVLTLDVPSISII